MKRLVGILGILFIVGCSNNSNLEIDKRIKEVNIDKKLMKKYHITTDDLVRFNDNYIFVSPSANGSNIVFLDKNFNEIKKVSTPFFDTRKLVIKDNKIYVLGNNETTYFPELIILDERGNVLKKISIPKKFALSKDVYVDKKGNYYVLVDVFENGKSHIEIYENGKLIRKLNLKNHSNGNFIFKIGNDLFVVGTVRNKDENAFIVNLNKGWIRVFDVGMDERFLSYKIEDNKIVLELLSTDNMGAESYYQIVIDLNGNIIKNETKIKLPILPTRFRT